MKRVMINTNQVGLVYKNGELKKVLTAGSYLLGFGQQLEVHDMNMPFKTNKDLNILLQHEGLASVLDVVTVGNNEAVLAYQDKNLKYVLTAGKHAFFKGINPYSYESFDMGKPFHTTRDINVLLQHEDLAAMLDMVLVGDNEMVLVYQDKNLKHILSAGKYAFFKGINAYSYTTVDLSKYEITEAIDKNLFDKPVFAPYIRTYRVEAHEKALMLVDGKFETVLEPGNYTYLKNSTVIQVAKADMRQLTMELGGQEILTKDKAQLRINFTVQYKVLNIISALLHNKEFEKQLYVIMQLALREYVGKLSFDELMEAKEKISENVLEMTVDKAVTLGVQLLGCGVKDIILPGDVKEIMNQVLIAEKRAQANIITRREETASARSLLNTAKLMEENAMLYKLKEMEYVEKIAEKINNISLSGGGQIVDQLKQLFVKQ